MKLQVAVYITLSLLGTVLSRPMEENYGLTESELESYVGPTVKPEVAADQVAAEQEEESEVQATVQQGELLQILVELA